MKRKVYYFLFTLLGAILGFLIHATIEINYIKLLMRNYGKYGLGMTWENWELIHFIGVVVLVLGSAWVGYRLGVRCWRVLYIEQRYSKVLGKKLKTDF